MTDEIRYTTRPSEPATSKARADDDLARVVVPAASLAALTAEQRQQAAALAAAPALAIDRLAERGLPLPIRAVGDRTRAAHLASELRSDTGLPLAVAAEPGTDTLVKLVGAVGAGAVAAVLLGAGAALTLGAAAAALTLLTVTALTILAVALWVAPGRREAAQVWSRSSDALDALHEARSALRGAFDDLHAVRERSLRADVPPAAQADLWALLDRVERGLAAGTLDATHAREALAQTTATLDDPGSPAELDALAQLRKSAQRIRNATPT